MSGLQTLEHVAVTVSITHPRRGSLELHLFCPSGMMSLIGAPRSMDSYVYPHTLSCLQQGLFQGKRPDHGRDPGPMVTLAAGSRSLWASHECFGADTALHIGVRQSFEDCAGLPVRPHVTNEETNWS